MRLISCAGFNHKNGLRLLCTEAAAFVRHSCGLRINRQLEKLRSKLTANVSRSSVLRPQAANQANANANAELVLSIKHLNAKLAKYNQMLCHTFAVGRAQINSQTS